MADKLSYRAPESACWLESSSSGSFLFLPGSIGEDILQLSATASLPEPSLQVLNDSSSQTHIISVVSWELV
jgi:hypothetical protein